MGTLRNSTGRIKRELPAEWLFKWGDTPQQMSTFVAMFDAVAMCCEVDVETVKTWPMAEVRTMMDEIMADAGMGNDESSDTPSDSCTASPSNWGAPIPGGSPAKWEPAPRSGGSTTSPPSGPRDEAHAAMLGRR